MSLGPNAINIIQKKRDKQKLSNDEIKWFIDSLTAGSIPDYQASALLMSIYLNGLDKTETAYLTDAMLYSGKVLKFDGVEYVDKHSTGGVGDKTTFILAPIAAALGVKVPMIAGRGLGHTGGTVDKIEAIKGFKTDISLDEFEKLIKERGMVLIGQTKEIAPADKILYALRDVTSTIESIPLITASIMSKKLAEGASGIVMDIKTGNGAFMSSLKDARALAKSIMDTGLRFKRNMMTVITDMNEPLGNYIGNSLELIECIETLKGRGPKDLTDISLSLAGGMAFLAGKAKSHKEGIAKAKAVVENGKALEKFKELIRNQGGDEKVIDDYSLLPMATEKFEVKASKNGYIKSFACKEFGLHCVALGGGRMKASDKIDFGVGLVLHKKSGDQVKKGDTLVTIYHHPNQLKLAQEMAQEILKKDIQFSASKSKSKKKLIYETKIKKVKGRI